MKRFLILFTLIAFSVVSCAGSTTIVEKKDNSLENQYNDRQKERIDSSSEDPTFWQTLRLLASYKENPDIQEPMSTEEILLIPVMVAAQLTALAIGIVARGGGHFK